MLQTLRYATRQTTTVAAGKGALGGDLKSLTDVFVKADGRLHELKKQQTDLEGKLGYDYGLEEAFGALVDKCYEAQVWDCQGLCMNAYYIYIYIYASEIYRCQ